MYVPGVGGAAGGLGVREGARGSVVVPLEGPRLQELSTLLHPLECLDGDEVIVHTLSLSVPTHPSGAWCVWGGVRV